MKPIHRVLAAATALVAAALSAPLPCSIAQVLQTGTITGTVRDAAGKPLSGVQITVTDTGQSDVTNAQGYFATTSVLPGVHTVQAGLVGYLPEQTTVTVTQELTTTVTLQLTRREVIDTGISRVTTVSLIRKNQPPTLYTVTSREEGLVRSSPGNLYQYPGAAISQPGVVPDADGFPTLRGSRRLNVGYMLDGILVVEPSSGEFTSSLVTVGMDRMNIYTGGYRAELGGAIGGMINAVVKTGLSLNGAALEATTGTWDYSSMVYEQGHVEKNGLNWYVSGNAFRTRFEKNPAYSGVPVSADMIAKAVQPLGKKDRLTALYTSGYSRYDVPLTDPITGTAWGADPTQPAILPDGSLNGMRAEHTLEFNDSTRSWMTTSPTQDYVNQGHNIGSLTLTHSLKPSASLSGQVYGWSHRKAVNAMDPFDGLWDSRTDNKVLAGKVDFSNQLNAALQVRAGGEIISGNNSDRLARFGLPGFAPGASLRIRDADTTDLNGYVSVTSKPVSQLTADMGVRYDTRTYHRRITDAEIAMGKASIKAADLEVLAHTGRNPRYDAVSPRLGLSYTLNANTVLKASAGRFSQFAPANYIENRYVPIADAAGGGDPTYYPRSKRKVFDVKPERVDSIDIGFERQLGKNLGLAVTPYWRRTRDMIDSGPSLGYDGKPLAGTAFSNLAHGHTHGVESKLQMRETRGLSGWVTYTYQVAKANAIGPAVGQGAADPARPDEEFRMSYDQRHTVYVVGQYVHGRFEINPMLELGSGYPWGGQPGDGHSTAYALDPSDPTGETELPILVNGKLQLSGINPNNTGWHRNLSVTFRLYNDTKKSSYYFVQVQNLLNSKDVTAKYWQNPYTGSNWLGYVPGETSYIDENGQARTASGHFEYKPWTRVPPIFVIMGVRQSF